MLHLIQMVRYSTTASTTATSPAQMPTLSRMAPPPVMHADMPQAGNAVFAYHAPNHRPRGWGRPGESGRPHPIIALAAGAGEGKRGVEEAVMSMPALCGAQPFQRPGGQPSQENHREPNGERPTQHSSHGFAKGYVPKFDDLAVR